MAKEIAGQIKVQIKGGAANPSPPVGPALGSKGYQHHGILQDNSMPAHKTKPVRFSRSNHLLYRQVVRLRSERLLHVAIQLRKQLT